MKFFNRLIYTARMGWQHRRQLKQIYQQTKLQQLCELIPERLQQQGVNVLVLDFDGVLAADGELEPTAECQNWLRHCVQIFGAAQIFILSNKPLPHRIAFFTTHFADVRCIAGVRKKPYPDGLQQIMELTAQSPQQILLADDRLLTGVLAGCIAQIQVCYITRPYVQLYNRPLSESFFISLRFFERLLMRLISG